MKYDMKSALWLILLWMVVTLLAFMLESCRSIRQTDTFAEESRSITLDEHQTHALEYTAIDSFLHRWAMTIEGFEADISIPLTTAPMYGEMTADTLLTDTTPHTPSHCPTRPPCIDIHLRGKSMKMDGESRGRTEQHVADSSDMTNKGTSQKHSTDEVRKKTTRLPAYLWWAAIPFVLFLITYIVRRWKKRN